MKDPELKTFAEAGLRFPLLAARDGYFTSSDCRIYYSVFGEGTPVVLLHGGMGNATNWAKQIEILVHSGYQAIVMDTRAHGRSSSGVQILSYKVFAQDICKLIEFLSLKQVILVGWSDGACTALAVAKNNPQLLHGVVFFACNVDATGLEEFRMTQRIENCLIRHERDFINMSPTLERFADLQPKLEPMQKSEPNYSAQQLSQIAVPVAVVQGDQDEFIKLEHAKYIARVLKNGHFELLTGLNHFAPIEDPDKFNHIMIKYIRMFEDKRPTF